MMFLTLFKYNFTDMTYIIFQATTHRTLVECATLSQIGVQLCMSRRNQFQLLNSATYPISNFLEYFFPMNLSAYMPFDGVRHK